MRRGIDNPDRVACERIDVLDMLGLGGYTRRYDRRPSASSSSSGTPPAASKRPTPRSLWGAIPMTAMERAARPEIESARPARGAGSLRPDAPRRTRIRFRQLVEHLPDVVYRFGLVPPRLEFVNRAVEGLLGVTPEELYADPELAYRLVDPAHLDEMRSTPTDPREIRPSTWRWRRTDGTYAALESFPVPVIDRAGRIASLSKGLPAMSPHA